MSSVWFPALLILVAAAVAYGVVVVIDAIVARSAGGSCAGSVGDRSGADGSRWRSSSERS